MNMMNVNEYLKLQRESKEDTVLIKKVGRLFCGPNNTMNKMYSLMQSNEIPVQFVDKAFLDNPLYEHTLKTFDGIQLRSKDHGFPEWSTLYTPVGYILKADNILSHLRQKILNSEENLPNVIKAYENHSVTQIDRL